MEIYSANIVINVFCDVFLAQIETESPRLKKVVFLDSKKRPKEALFEFYKNTFLRLDL